MVGRRGGGEEGDSYALPLPNDGAKLSEAWET